MYREYARGDSANWSTGVRSAERFIAGPLLGHVTTWPRHGRLGVPAGLDGRALCAALSRWLADLAAFGLLYAGPNPRLLVIPITTSHPCVTLCYGQWPGMETWEQQVEGRLPEGMTLLHTRWNEMPMPLPVPAPMAPKRARLHDHGEATLRAGARCASGDDVPRRT